MIYKKFGAPDVLELQDIEKPAPKDNEVLIRIFATTVTSADCMMRRGDTILSRILLGFTKPKPRYQILGTEFSGVIESVGIKVNRFQQGDRVYGFRGFGTGCYAEYKCMPETGSLAIMPDNLSFEEAVSFVDGATTAIFFLKDKARIQSGQKVLIIGASGSIGTFAVQLAKYFGTEVTGVCGSKNGEFVRLLGADQVIDYAQTDFANSGEKYDIIFDTVGKSSFGHCKDALGKNGKYVVTKLSISLILMSLWTRIAGGKRIISAMSLNKTDALNFIKTLIEDGKLQSVIDRTYPFEQLAEAHRYVEKGHKKGNVVIVFMSLPDSQNRSGCDFSGQRRASENHQDKWVDC